MSLFDISSNVLDTVPFPGELILLIDHLADGPIIAAQLKVLTDKDPLLMKVHYFVRNGCQNTTNDTDMKL